MIEFGKESKRLIRQVAIDAFDSAEDVNGESIQGALDYISRRTDIKNTKDAMKARFAVYLHKHETDGYAFYSNKPHGEAIDAGLYEAISSGLGSRLISSLGNLFTMPTQKWIFTSSAGTDSDAATELILAHREAGGFDTEVVSWDKLGCYLETAPMLVQLTNGHLNYNAFGIQSIFFKWADHIIDGDVTRGVNRKDIEDASAIVIQLDGGEGDKKNFLAIFGRSELYPYGRHVQYSASRWNEIPFDFQPGCVEHTIDSAGTIQANPLSYLAANSNSYVPEYPVAFIFGGQCLDRSQIKEVNFSMYENCTEIDLAYSRIMKDALSAATGTGIFTDQHGNPMPQTTEGIISLQPGQDFKWASKVGININYALVALKDISKIVGEGFSVPGYQIIAEQGMAESGVALIVRTQPMINFREFREKLNKNNVDRLFNIEKGLLKYAAIADLDNVTQNWDAGEYIIPEAEVDKIARLKAALDAGGISYVQFVRELHNLPSDEDAKKMIETINDQNAENPAPKAAKTTLPGGLTARPGFGK